MSLPDFIDDLGHGVFAVDTGFVRTRFDASYLLVQAGRAAFIDTGTNHAVPRLLQALAALGLAPDAVDWVVPTHVHLDHAGGAGLLMQHLPRARLAVHPRGARHMIDPSALYEGALAVYGPAEMERAYGRLVPVAPERVRATHEGLRLSLADRALEFIDLPGHARHHHGIWDATSRCWFTGDSFGVGYGELANHNGPFILASHPPSQFEPAVLQASIQRLMQRGPDGMCLTHYGRVGGAGQLARLAAQLHAQIDAVVALGQAVRACCPAGPQREQQLAQGLCTLYGQWLQAHDCADLPGGLALLATDIRLNAQGLAHWLSRIDDKA
ncbi:Zn-dependent hydrolase, glyoxylase [Burkholderiales bacterium JOSHI_001]|nr:Zn-dependent hydrolase, glyoxylase [Burkholderiales bacterium JOSHI_001]